VVVFVLDDLRPKAFDALVPPLAFAVLPSQSDFVMPGYRVIETVSFETLAAFLVLCRSCFFYGRQFRIDIDLAKGYEEAYVSADLWRG
jgi:hypothetical protein